ncbi:Rgp1-domain-containing protein [Crepidotus variabilis]|uniref:Rgp1-domain-containing protein n=1 Tax=Crepidotus variabilis TaxID=179855 RepID=A0A9P6EDN8_9AGAR|nr:Rgp1-domain-containing protein [Crepidotus variabilis]
MPGLSIGDHDSPIRIVVTPSQSSYFAGEPFSVEVSFTNTRSPEAGPSKPPHSHHKRGAHSVSSAPLARPPTSPGTPRTLATPSSSSRPRNGTEETPRRKYFIGKSTQPKVTSASQHEHIPELLEQRRKRQLAPTKSLSVSVSQHDLHDALGVVSSAPHSQNSFVLPSPTAPHIPSPLARSHALQLASDHPHARKDSILDGQFSLDFLSPTTSNPPVVPYTPSSSTSSFSLALDPIAEGVRSPYPSTPALGSPTIESTTLPPPHIYPHHQSHSQLQPPPSPITGPATNAVYGYPVRPQGYRPAPIGLGHPSTSTTGPNTANPPRVLPRLATEIILYSYAQLSGTLILTPTTLTSSTPASFDPAQTLAHIRGSLLNRSVLGGGSMDISSTLNSPVPASPRTPRHPMQRQHSRSASLSAGLLSMLSPTSLVSSISSPSPLSAASSTFPTSASLAPPSSAKLGWRSNSGSGSLQSSTPTPTTGIFGLGFGSTLSDIDPEEPLPTFEVQPSMLAVDLSLAPGETRSYTYTIKLPDNLPPTFKGKTLRFSYELIVGTCRAGSSGNPGLGVGANSISRVMKVPIRLYNNVSVSRTIRPYDLLWPVSRRRDVGMPGTEAKVEENKEMQQPNGLLRVPSLSSTPSSTLGSSGTLESIRDYARSLLESFPESTFHNRGSISSPTLDPDFISHPGTNGTANGHLPNDHSKQMNGTLIPPPKRMMSTRSEELRRIEMEREREAEGGLTGCREAVEILTRNPKKASYDVNKEGVKVAVLTFTKSAYRLGETITGVVEVNERIGRSRVLKVSAILESQESLPSSITSSTSNPKLLQRSHAESHSSFTLNTARTTFSLDIPSDASPAFQIRVGTPPLSTPNSPSMSSTQTNPKLGGLDWKVRLCLLVAVAAEQSMTGSQGVRFRSIERDGLRGEWGSSWTASKGNAPFERRDLRAERDAVRRKQIASPKSWSQFFVSSLFGDPGNEVQPDEKRYHDGDDLDSLADAEDDRDSLRSGSVSLDKLSTQSGLTGGEPVEYDGIIPNLGGGVGVGVDFVGGEDGWKEVKLETVECEVPVKIYPGNTAFKALDVVFDV